MCREMCREKIELLAPAKTKEHAICAINYGADAVYIGGPAFSARAVASNSITDIMEVVSYAHKFGAKVYVALNTILSDEEVEEAKKIVSRLCIIGVDALITQDFAFVTLMHEDKIPLIHLHASTQMDNRTPEKVKFLEDCGFEQVVVARESSLETIKAIADATSVRLETFVHGALCVSYSGQCYLSERLMGRSANRGECGQPCRLPYTLVDADGKVIAKDKHLLSLKDFCAEEYIEKLILAGVSSFKIEGRLKDISYVKNVTAYYRKAIDNILAKHPEYSRSSDGISNPAFTPCLEKSFNRGFTTYNLSGKRTDIASIDSPKSKGEYIGKVVSQTGNKIIIDSKAILANGDGFTYTENGAPKGFRADKAEEGVIYAPQGVRIAKGTALYRNFDKAFEDELAKDNTTRLLPIEFSVYDEEDSIKITGTCRDWSITNKIDIEMQPAQDIEKSRANIEKVLSKTGGTNFVVNKVNVTTDCFIPNSVLANCRRDFLDEFESFFVSYEPPFLVRSEYINPIWKDGYVAPLPTDYHANVHNKIARDFVSRLRNGAFVSYSFEKTHEEEIELMRCHHCIRHTLGICKKEAHKQNYREPFYLITPHGQRLRLKFECDKCEMVVIG